MTTAQALLYLVAVILLALAGVGVTARVGLIPLAAACALLAYALPVIATL